MRGRPKVEKPKNKGLRIRLDIDIKRKLKECSEHSNMSQSELIRSLIKEYYDIKVLGEGRY